MNFLKKLFKKRKAALGIFLTLLFTIPLFSEAQTVAGLTRTELNLLQQRHPGIFSAPNYDAVPTPPLYDYFILQDRPRVIRVLMVILQTDDEFYNRLNEFERAYGNENDPEVKKLIAEQAGSELRIIASQGLNNVLNSDDSVPLGIAQADYDRDLNRLRDLAELENANTPEGQADLEETRRTADPNKIIPGDNGPSEEIKCSMDWNFDVVSCAKAMIIYVSTEIIIPLFGSILVGATLLFDGAISFSVTSFAEVIDNFGSLQSTWAIIRDLANIFFIFILLYAAIGMTLRLKDIDAKKIIVRVIVIALLINFSAFFTRVVIDASNLLAYQFYNGIEASSKEYKIFGGTKSIKGVAGALMSGLSLEKQFTGIKTNPDGSTSSVVKGKFVQIISSLLGAIFVIVVSTFVILAGTIMLLIRIVTLVFLIILSPLAFFALAMPGKMSGQFDKWFSSLVSQCFFAPAYLIFLFVSSKLISGIDFSQGTNTVMNVWLQFFVVIGFLLASLIIASKMGAFGAQKAIGWAGKINRSAFGTLTKLGKVSVRTAANVLSKEGRERNRESGARISGSLKDWSKKVGENWNKDKKGEGGLAGAAWKAGVRTAKYGEKNVPLGKEVGEFLRKPLSTGSEHIAALSAASPLGFKAGILGPTKDEEAEKRKKEKDAKDAEREEKLNKKKSDFDKLDLEDEQKVKDFLKTLKREEITKMDKKKLEKIAHLLNSSYLDALADDMESGDFEKIKTAFASKLAGFVSAEPKDDAPQVDKDNFKAMYQNEINKIVNSYEPKVLKRLPTEQLTSPAVVTAMSAQMIRELLEHGDLSGETERLIKDRVIQAGESHDAYGYVMRSTGRNIPSGPGRASGTPPDTTSGIDVPTGGVGI